MHETFYDLLRRQGMSRRSFLKFCGLSAAALGLSPSYAPQIAQALETKRRLPVLWLNGLECTCCSESLIRSGHPLASDAILSMLSMDYNELLMAAAGEQAETALAEAQRERRGEYILAVEGNPPLEQDGMSCLVGGRPFVDKLRETAADARAVIAWGSCASSGCVQAASPNPTGATPVQDIVHDKPVINIPGCPPIAEVMTGVITYILTFDRLPELDRQGRPVAFYGERIHDKCYRRAHYDAGQFAEAFDDEGARRGYCLYKLGCKGPTTYNACATMGWNGGISFPIQSGHGCIGCSEPGFWDQGGFYERQAAVPGLGVESSADTVGAVAAAAVGGAVAAHATASAVKQARSRRDTDHDHD
ncbi:MAG: hydrogenase small subunit [Halorhodospira sp.]